jgi:amino acid transporter
MHLEPEETLHGRHMGVTDVVMMIVHRIIGSGIFAVSSMIYRDVGGSPALFFLVWIISGYSSYAGLICFSELGSVIPRSGGLKVFLQVIYNKPFMMINVVFGIFIVIFGSICANVMIFGEYLLYSFGYPDGEFMNEWFKPIGFAFLTIVSIMLLISTKFVIKLQTFTGILKVILLSAVSLMGLYVLFLPSSITKIPNNLHASDFFKIKTQVTLSSFTSAILKGIFSFNGWHTTHNVLGEIKDPVRTIKIAAPLAILLINLCYFLINLTYLIVIPSNELLEINEMVGLVLFEKFFGDSIGKIILSSLIAFSVGGNIITVIYHISRMNQEIFREGFLPYSKFFASNWPFGSPAPSLLIPFVITSSFLIIPTDSNIFNYAINLESYPTQIFFGLACLGILILRYRSPEIIPGIQASYLDIGFMIIFSLFMFLGPLIHPDNDEFKGLPNYAYTSIIILALCMFYWLIMFKILPKVFKYKLIKQDLTLDDGLVVVEWQKVPKSEEGGLYQPIV